MCATSWCDLDFTFHLDVVTLSLKILSGLYLRNCKVYIWWLTFGGVGVQCHGVTLI